MAYWLLKVLLTPILHLLWRVRVDGQEHVPARGPAVLAANHQSFCDSLFLPLVVRRKVTYLAKAEYFDSWRAAWFFRAIGQIPIRRGGGSESERALVTAAEALAKGGVIALYPEGTRAMDRHTHRGRTGVARLSHHCGAPVVPVGISGTVEVQPVGSRRLHPFKTVTVRFGLPMRMPPPERTGVPPGHGVRGDPGVPGVCGGQLPGAHDEEHEAFRGFTDHLMHEVARLSGRTYVDEYVPARTPVA